MFRLDPSSTAPAGRRPRDRAHAREVVERNYRDLHCGTIEAVAGKLRQRALHVARIDLEAFYNEAWLTLHERLLDGDEIANVPGFLVLVTYRRALDEALRRPQPVADPLAEAEADARAAEADMVERLERRRRLRELLEGLRSELNGPERAAATLCYVHGLTRAQAAEELGITPGRMKKVMDGAAVTVARLVRDIDAGRRCTDRRSTNAAFALGMLDPAGERLALTRAHLRACPSCRADVRQAHEARPRRVPVAA